MWEGVYVFQKLILVCAAILIIHRLGKLITLLVLLLVFLVIHIRVQPYQERMVNVAEGYSLLSLILVVVVNLYWATSYMDKEYTLSLGYFLTIFHDVIVVITPIVLLLMFGGYMLAKHFGYCGPAQGDQAPLTEPKPHTKAV